MDKKLEDKIKKQDKEIADLKKAINVLQQTMKKMHLQINRANDQARRAHNDISVLTKTIENIKRMI